MTIVEENKVVEPKTDPQVIEENISQPQEEKKVEDQEDPNWRAARESLKKARQQREEAERLAKQKAQEAEALKAALEAITSKPIQQFTQHPQHQQEYESEDQRIERLVQLQVTKIEENLRKQRYEEEQRLAPQRAAQTFPDFYQVMSEENLHYLEYHYPEVARPLQRIQDKTEQMLDTYHAVKKFVPNPTTAKKDAQRAEINQMKPKSMSSMGATQQESPRPIHLTDDQKAANWKRMQRTLSSMG